VLRRVVEAHGGRMIDPELPIHFEVRRPEPSLFDYS
jgi:hypothetical protein